MIDEQCGYEIRKLIIYVLIHRYLGGKKSVMGSSKKKKCRKWRILNGTRGFRTTANLVDTSVVE